jgi:hypothetical protein
MCVPQTMAYFAPPSNPMPNGNLPIQPGDVVSVDQMVSPIPGFVGEMTGRLTTSRYKCATVYVDQASHLSYVHLQRTADASETLEGKTQFEKFAANRGVKIKHYHANNGIFRANAWVQHCTANNEGLTFAGVNAHHQNGIAEKRIRVQYTQYVRTLPQYVCIKSTE